MKRDLERALERLLHRRRAVQRLRDGGDDLEVIDRELKLDTGWVWLVDPDTGHVYSAAARNLPPYLQEPVCMTGSTCWCIEQFRDGALERHHGLQPSASGRAGATGRADARHRPSRVGSFVFSGQGAGHHEHHRAEMRRLSSRELRLLSTIGFQLGVAIEGARLADESATHARADERTRLAREIHDTIAQSLTAIALRIESGQPEEALRVTRATLEEARRSVMNLRAEPLAGKPLAQALALLVRGASGRASRAGRCVS